MRKILSILTIILISNCKSDNRKDKNLTTESYHQVSELPKVSQFQAFIDQFPTKTLPIKIYGCTDELLELPKLDVNLSSKFSNDAKSEYIFGVVSCLGDYILTITLLEGECLMPTLNTYNFNGDKIDSKQISLGLCGPDTCYECVEAMTLNSEYQIYVADTIKTFDCDDNFNAIAGTEKIKVVYKEGKLTENGIIELTEKLEKSIK